MISFNQHSAQEWLHEYEVTIHNRAALHTVNTALGICEHIHKNFNVAVLRQSQLQSTTASTHACLWLLQDQTQTDLINLRRTIYLTIMSSAQFEEAGHKLMKIQLGQGQEIEVVTMLIECCSQEKTYIRHGSCAYTAAMQGKCAV